MRWPDYNGTDSGPNICAENFTVGIIGACRIFPKGMLFKPINFSVAQSYISTLEALRKAMVEKWQRVPMGYFQNNTLGSLKTSFVDRIDSMEPILAHMFPEMTANLLFLSLF